MDGTAADRGREYFGQHGEDVVLWAVFEGRERGFFVEVGGLEGRRMSNTWGFERAGWTGVVVEPHPAYFPLLRANRPGSRCVHAAVSDTVRDSVPFYANIRGALSTLDPSFGAAYAEHYGNAFQGFEELTVTQITLDRLLEIHAPPGEIDFVSIDVEGHEPAVMRGFDLARWRPRIVVVEEFSRETAAATRREFTAAGYMRARALGCNAFYCRDAVDLEPVRSASVDVALTVVEHPLEAGLLGA